MDVVYNKESLYTPIFFQFKQSRFTWTCLFRHAATRRYSNPTVRAPKLSRHGPLKSYLARI